MLRERNIDRACCIVLAVTLIVTCGYMGAAAAGLIGKNDGIGYENRLFDSSRVHTLDIVMDDWDGFIEQCTDEEYAACTVVIDGEKYGNVAIRAKGNTSLSSVAAYGNDRYSFKIEFDHYQTGKTYYGLDKLCLNNIIQDKTYLKDYLAYTLMNKMGVPAPLCSFVQINVNGEAWGLYLAVEGVEDGFLARSYGASTGNLYKPDSMSFGGGRGNGRDFDMDDFREQFDAQEDASDSAGVSDSAPQGGDFTPPGMPGGGDFTPGEDFSPGDMPNGAGFPAGGDFTPGEDFTPPDMQGGGGFGGFGGMGSDDVKLKYIDDDPDSYSNIFTSAKTNIDDEDEARLIASLKALSEGGEAAAALIDPYVEADTNGFFTYDQFQTGAAALREFCLLRAESITGQLDGTIPSTSAGQSADFSALVDASSVSLSDMGEFSGGGGGGNRGGGNGGGTPGGRFGGARDGSAQNSGAQKPGSASQNTNTLDQGAQGAPENSRPSFSPPDAGFSESASRGTDATAIVWFSASVLLLALAIVFAWRFKNHR